MGRRCILDSKRADSIQTPRFRTFQPKSTMSAPSQNTSIRCKPTIACNPTRVNMNRWCTRPYSISAEDSTKDTSGILAASSSALAYRQHLQRDIRGVRRTRFNIQHHLHRLFPKRHDRIEPSKVKVVLDKVFRHFAKVFVSRQRAEPADPSQS